MENEIQNGQLINNLTNERNTLEEQVFASEVQMNLMRELFVATIQEANGGFINMENEIQALEGQLNHLTNERNSLEDQVFQYEVQMNISGEFLVATIVQLVDVGNEIQGLILGFVGWINTLQNDNDTLLAAQLNLTNQRAALEPRRDQLQAALADAQRNHDNALRDAQRNHDNALRAAQQTHDNALRAAQQRYNNALAYAQGNHENDLREVRAERDALQKQINDLSEKKKSGVRQKLKDIFTKKKKNNGGDDHDQGTSSTI